jgi:MFS family permease
MATLPQSSVSLLVCFRLFLRHAHWLILCRPGQPSFNAYFELATRPNGTDLISTMNGLFQTGGFLGTLCLPLVADKWGRKWAIAVSAIFIVVSGAFLGGSVNIGEFIFFRFIAGAGAFMILAAVPIWMNEVVPSHLRGALVDIHAVLLVIGYMMASWIGLGFFYVTSPSAWRGPLCMQCIWPLLLLSGLYWIPESPRW